MVDDVGLGYPPPPHLKGVGVTGWPPEVQVVRPGESSTSEVPLKDSSSVNMVVAAAAVAPPPTSKLQYYHLNKTTVCEIR